MSKKIALIALLIILAVANFTIYKKESLIKNGDTIYLALAPVDPRSIMQGDYMSLNFAIGDSIVKELLKGKMMMAYQLKSQSGYVLVYTDNKHIANFKRLLKDKKPNLAPNEYILKYSQKRGQVKIATNAYFFQEGKGKKYQKAKYGVFKVNKSGDFILKALADKDLKIIE